MCPVRVRVASVSPRWTRIGSAVVPSRSQRPRLASSGTWGRSGTSRATRTAKKLTVVKLRKKLEAAGADTKGLKAVLVARLVEVEWATAVVEHATAMAAARSLDVELAPPAPPAAETLAPKTPEPRLSLLSATAHSPADETADETALESLTPLQKIFRVSRAVLCDFPQRVEPLSGWWCVLQIQYPLWVPLIGSLRRVERRILPRHEGVKS